MQTSKERKRSRCRRRQSEGRVARADSLRKARISIADARRMATITTSIAISTAATAYQPALNAACSGLPVKMATADCSLAGKSHWTRSRISKCRERTGIADRHVRGINRIAPIQPKKWDVPANSKHALVLKRKLHLQGRDLWQNGRVGSQHRVDVSTSAPLHLEGVCGFPVRLGREDAGDAQCPCSPA